MPASLETQKSESPMQIEKSIRYQVSRRRASVIFIGQETPASTSRKSLYASVLCHSTRAEALKLVCRAVHPQPVGEGSA